MLHSVSRAALAAALLSSTSIAGAQTAQDNEEIIVTATRAPKGIGRDQLGASVTVISNVDMALRQVRTVSDVLRDVPGLSISRLGSVGGITQVRMRGSEANHTLVLIDGIEASDAFTGEYDLSALLSDDVSRIEVLRGQQSALYGSDAIGGVINYITLSGRERAGLSGRVEGGSFGTFEAAVRAAGYENGFDYALSAGHQRTDGVPTARFGTRNVGAETSNATLKLGYEVAPNVRLRAVGRYTHTSAETNDQDFDWTSPTYGLVIDSDDYSKITSLFGLVGADVDLMGGDWTHSVTLQGAGTERDAFSGGSREAGSEGSRIKASYVTSYQFGDEDVLHRLTGAVDYEKEWFRNTSLFLNPSQEQEYSTRNVGLVAQYDLLLGKTAGFGAAVRHDDNDRFEDATTYRVQGSYLFDFGLRAHAAAGTGFKAPGASEIFGYDPSNHLPNPDLKPEKSEGWEVGLEQRFLDAALIVDVTYFNATLTDEIFTDFSAFPDTISRNRLIESEQQGVEVSAQLLLDEAWRVFASYTYLESEENGVEEVRRPPHIGSFNLSYVDPGERFSGTLTVRYNGETFDNDFGTGSRVVLDSFTLVNIAGDVRLTDDLRVFARVENVFDEEYEEVFSYRTAGRGFYIGLKGAF